MMEKVIRGLLVSRAQMELEVGGLKMAMRNLMEHVQECQRSIVDCDSSISQIDIALDKLDPKREVRAVIAAERAAKEERSKAVLPMTATDLDGNQKAA
jgi:hypothetical protein